MTERLIPPISESDLPEGSSRTLRVIGKALGSVPHTFLTAAHSPPALNALWSLIEATEQMRLPARVREGIALRVAEINHCQYCLAAHTARAKRFGIDETDITNFRMGRANDPKEQALLGLTTKIVKDRGHHAGFVVEVARLLGVTDAELIEVIALIAMNTFTNYLHSVAGTETDFPETGARSWSTNRNISLPDAKV